MASRLPPRLAASVALLLFSGPLGCAQVLGIEDTSVGEEAPPTGRDWRCVGKTQNPTTAQNIQIRARVTDFFGFPLPGLTVDACAVAANPNCDNPIASAVSSESEEQLGIATLDIPGNVPFTGYLQLRGGPERVPYISYYSRPIAGPLQDPIPFLSVTWAELDLAIPGDADAIDGRGHLFVNATDCQNVDAPDMTFHVLSDGFMDDQSVTFYANNNGFSDTATETIGGVNGGRGGVFNLLVDEPRRIEFEARSGDTGGVTATGEWWILPNTLTTGRLLPQ